MSNQHDIGDTVFVLCRHKHWNTPSLMKTSVTGLSITENGEALRFAAAEDTDIVVEVFGSDHEREARKALADAIEFHKKNRVRRS